MDHLDFMDKRKYLPKKETLDNNVTSQPINVLDAMKPPSSSPDVPAKKPMNLVNLLDSTTRLPRDSRGPSGCRRVSILDVLEKQRH
jgi:hypothetical protein